MSDRLTNPGDLSKNAIIEVMAQHARRQKKSTGSTSQEVGGQDPYDGPDTPTDEFDVVLAWGLAANLRSGLITVEPAGTATIGETPNGTDPESYTFDFRSASMLVVTVLPATGATDIIYHRDSDSTLWFDANGAGTWTQIGGGSLDGAGTADKLAYWAHADTLADTNIDYDSINNALSLIAGSLLVNITPSTIFAQGNTSTITQWAGSVVGDSNSRHTVDAAGTHKWGSGSGAADIELARLNANILGLAAGDAFRAGDYLELAEQGSSPSTPASGYGRFFTKSDGYAYHLNDGGTERQYTGPRIRSLPWLKVVDSDSAAPSFINVAMAHTFNDTGSRENVKFYAVPLPDDYDPSVGLIVTAYGMSRFATTGTTGHFGVEGVCFGPGDNPTGVIVYGTAVTVNKTLNTVGAGAQRVETITFSNVVPAGATAGDYLILRFYRDSSNASDNYNGIFYLTHLRVEYTTTGAYSE